LHFDNVGAHLLKYNKTVLNKNTIYQFEYFVGGVRHPQNPQISSNFSTIAADNNTV
jgi:hypothetical protein